MGRTPARERERNRPGFRQSPDDLGEKRGLTRVFRNPFGMPPPGVDNLYQLCRQSSSRFGSNQPVAPAKDSAFPRIILLNEGVCGPRRPDNHRKEK